jgi:hypothetical protein
VATLVVPPPAVTATFATLLPLFSTGSVASDIVKGIAIRAQAAGSVGEVVRHHVANLPMPARRGRGWYGLKSTAADQSVAWHAWMLAMPVRVVRLTGRPIWQDDAGIVRAPAIQLRWHSVRTGTCPYEGTATF